MIEFIKSTFPIILLLTVILFLCWGIFKLWKHIRVAKALNAPHDKHYLHNLFSEAFGREAVKYRVRLPQKLYSAPTDALLIDCMIISQGGITILELLPFKGALDNPYIGEWGIKTVNGIQSFSNPFEAGNAHVEVLRKLLATAGIYNAAIQVIVLMQEDQVVLHYHNEKILTPAKLITYIKDQNRNRFLGRSEQKKVMTLLDRFTEQSIRKQKHSRPNRN